MQLLIAINGGFKQDVKSKQLPEIANQIFSQLRRAEFFHCERLANKKSFKLDPFDVRMIGIKTAWAILAFHHRLKARLETLFERFVGKELLKGL